MIQKLIKGLTNPSKAAGYVRNNYNFAKLNIKYYEIINKSGFNDNGEKIVQKDWDNMIILDACRYDTFRNYARDHIEANDISYSLSKSQSVGSSTPEFLYGNIHNVDMTDTVYITANPMHERLSNRTYAWAPEKLNTRFHDVDDVWASDGWNENHNTVLPETVTRRAKRAHDRFPNKRLLIHYIQPHFPFIESDIYNECGARPDPESDDDDIWSLMGSGQISPTQDVRARVREAYKRNLIRAVPGVIDLIKAVEGLSVITSDHGNMIGEISLPFPTRVYGHPTGLYSNELVDVPWMEIENPNRRRITFDNPVSNEEHEQTKISTRLENLGYH